MEDFITKELITDCESISGENLSLGSSYGKKTSFTNILTLRKMFQRNTDAIRVCSGRLPLVSVPRVRSGQRTVAQNKI